MNSAGSKSQTRRTARRDWIISLVLVLVTLAAFGRVLNAGFVKWDDDISVSANSSVQGLSWGRLGWMFSDATYAMRYKPLTWLAYALIYEGFGLSPFAYHLTNLVLHGFNAVLVFVIIRRLLTLSSSGSNATQTACGATLPAALGALLWACHPLRVEPVARITDLTYCLVLFFLMISLWFYLRAWESRLDARAHNRFYTCSVAAFALAMLTYPVAFGWALVLLALDWYPLRRFEGPAAGKDVNPTRGAFGVRRIPPLSARQRVGMPCTRKASRTEFAPGEAAVQGGPGLRGLLKEKVPFVLLGGVVLVTLFARANPSVVWEQPTGGLGLNWFERGMQAFYVWAYYLWRPWAPFHLSPVYTTLIELNALDWRFLLSAVLVLGTTAVVVWKRHRWPWAVVLWISYLTLLLPALGLTEHPHYTSDRYDYLPGLVWALVLATGLWKMSLRPRLHNAAMVCAIALAVFWASFSFQQVRIWRDTTTLFEYMVRELGSDPGRTDLRRRLAQLYVGQGRTADAVQQLQTSSRLKPEAKTYQALGELLERNGDAQGALTNYLASAALSPDAWTHFRAAAQLSALGRTGEANNQYQEALHLQPRLAPMIERGLRQSSATDMGKSGQRRD